MTDYLNVLTGSNHGKGLSLIVQSSFCDGIFAKQYEAFARLRVKDGLAKKIYQMKSEIFKKIHVHKYVPNKKAAMKL